MRWDDNGVRSLKTYAKPEDSLEDFKKLWARAYGGRMPDYRLASKYTGNQNPIEWLSIVREKYKEYLPS